MMLALLIPVLSEFSLDVGHIQIALVDGQNFP